MHLINSFRLARDSFREAMEDWGGGGVPKMATGNLFRFSGRGYGLVILKKIDLLYI